MQPNSLTSVLIRVTYQQQIKDDSFTPADAQKKYLRPLTDYPAGKLGFYYDDEVTGNWLAHCRALLNDDRDEEVLPYAFEGD